MVSFQPEFATVFGSTLAFQLYTSLCDVISGHEQESLIRDLYLQQGLTDRSLSIKEDGKKLKLERFSNL